MQKLDLAPLTAAFYEFFTTIYKEKIDDLLLVYPKKRSLEIDYQELERFDHELADRLIKEPEAVFEAAEQCIKEMNLVLPSGTGTFSPHVRTCNVPEHGLLIENLSSKNLGELVAVKAVVTKRTEVMHKVKIAVYECQICEARTRTPVTKNFSPPKRCESCKKFALRQLEEESKFSDVQRGEVQELLERVSGGSPAAHVEIWMEDDLVNTIAPGDNIELAGILRLRPPLRTRQKQELVYGRYLDIVHIKSMKKDFEEIEINREEEREILELSKDPNIEQMIVDSVAPGIYGHEEVKRALALQLFGGTKGKSMKGGISIRDDIHVLLVGDPGLAKTRFLQHTDEIAPKSIYVSGKTTTGTGLTVTAEKDELGEGGWTLKAGALVLASGGTAMIDEFDKIEEDDRSALHEALESQTLSIAKAGIVAKFKAKTAVLAAANPRYGRFDMNKNLADQYDIPPTLMSRFDLIFPIIDVLDVEKDTQLAEHILASHVGKETTIEKRTIERDVLRKYIAYARRKILPKLRSEATDLIKEFYVEMRTRSKEADTVAITPRYLEGLVRLAEANAKMRLSRTVDARDAQTAIGLMNHVMRQVMTDKATGLYDVDTVATGKPKSEREKMQKVDTVIDIIRDHLRKQESAEINAVIQDAASYGLDENTARRIIAELLRKGDLYEREQGYVRLVGER